MHNRITTNRPPILASVPDPFSGGPPGQEDEVPFAALVEQGLEVAKTYAWLILGVTVAVATLVGFWTARQPKIYQAVTRIELLRSPPRPLKNEVEDVNETFLNYFGAMDWAATQLEVIRSRELSKAVVLKLGLHRDPDFGGSRTKSGEAPSPAMLDGAAIQLQGMIMLEQLENTYIVLIEIRDTKPERAQAIANAIADVYLEKSGEERLDSTTNALHWLSDQVDELKKKLEQSELALHDFKKNNGILSLSLEGNQNIIAADIQRYSEKMAEARVRRMELQVRLKELLAAYDEDPAKINNTFITDNENIQRLRQQYQQKQTEYQAMATRYGDNYPDIRRLAAERESLRRQMRDEIDGLIEGVRSELNQARAAEQRFRAALDQARAAGLELNLREIEYKRLERERQSNDRLYGFVLEKTAEAGLTRMLKLSNVRILERALLPTAAVSPNLQSSVVKGVLAGLLLGILLAVGLSKLDQTINGTPDVERAGLMVLGIIPRIGGKKPLGLGKNGGAEEARSAELFVYRTPKSVAAECCRAIRTTLAFMAPNRDLQTVAVTSAGPLEGKTTLAINLAVSMAQSGKKVLLIDSDLRRPRINKVFEMPSERGVTSVIEGVCVLADAVQQSEVENLSVLACGSVPPNPSELLHSRAFSQLLEEAGKEYKAIILDSPPLGVVTDGTIVAPQVDGVILVARDRSTTRTALRGALRTLNDVSANVLGCVLNDVDTSRRSYGYGTGRYYYYYRDESEQPAAEAGKDSADA